MNWTKPTPWWHIDMSHCNPDNLPDGWEFVDCLHKKEGDFSAYGHREDYVFRRYRLYQNGNCLGFISEDKLNDPST